MKICKLLLGILTLLLLFENCATPKWKDTLAFSGNKNDAVNNAITDFLNTSNLSKKDSIFGINLTDNNDGILIISICGAVNKIYPKSEYKTGTYDEIIPSQYIIKERKLFYWIDTTQVISQEIINVLKRYDHIDFTWSEEYIIPPLIIDDGKEGVVFYFCKNNFRNYKKTGSNTIYKHFDPPVLNCSRSK